MKRTHKRRGSVDWRTRPIVFVDGEGTDRRDGSHAYQLLGTYWGPGEDESETLYDRAGLHTDRALQFLLDDRKRPRDAQYVWYGGGYDTNMILRNVPWMWGKRRHGLAELVEEKHASWKQYALRYRNRSLFGVTSLCTVHRRDRKAPPRRDCPRCQSVTIYDMLGLFGTTFEAAYVARFGRIPKIVREGKKNRARFATLPIAEIRAYHRAEMACGLKLLYAFRADVERCGLRLSVPNSLGAIAGEFLTRHKFHDTMPPYYPVEKSIVMRACFGGRIDAAGYGLFDPAWHYDMRSAYAWGMSRVPNLNRLFGTWRRRKGPQEAAGLRPYALVHVSWSVHPKTRWMPFPWRAFDGTILYPPQGEGWFFACEVAAAQARFGERITIVEAWNPAGQHEEPLRAPIEALFAQRMTLAAAGDPAADMLKRVMATFWGKAAQKGDPNSPHADPKFQDYFIAGYVQAQVRARLAEAIALCGDVVSVTTDGFFARSRAPIALSDELGAWKHEPGVDRVAIVGPGLHTATGDGGTIAQQKQRGFSGPPINFEHVLSGLGLLPYEKRYAEAHVIEQREFIGMHSAHVDRGLLERRCTWRTTHEPIPNPLHGNGKRMAWGGNRYEDDAFTAPQFRRPGVVFLDAAPREPDAPLLSHPYNPHAYANGEDLLNLHDEILLSYDEKASGECLD